MSSCRVLVPARTRRRGFTLAELIVSVASASLLLAGMMSAIFLAIRSADTNADTALAVEGSFVLEDIVAELRDAVYFKQRTATVVSFTVPDRDGDGDVESIRYSWSGIAGGSLMRTYNGGTAIAVVENVYGFALDYKTQVNPISGRVLMVVPDEYNLDTDDTGKKSAMEGWGYTVTPVSPKRDNNELDTMAALVDAIYISENILSSDLNTKLNDATAGIVNEEAALHDDLKLSSAGGGAYTGTQIRIADNTHYVTSAFAIGAVQMATSAQPIVTMSGTLAPDLQVLTQDSSGTTPSLTVIGTGGALQDGTAAAGPRITLSMGNDFTFSALHSNGLTLLQRALDWAARKYVVTSVGIKLQTGNDTSSAVQTRTEVFSRPRA
ncbi:MAG: hypothetical protein O3C40_02885 [Planctomycetota bacterium]|nr:hypothetical protein [Planctomycetota bacterium]